MRRVYLVRHGKAGDRHRFKGNDRDRPLTANGLRQADLLVELLAQNEALPGRILSSPAERCRQTVEPLAKRLGLDVEIEEWLDEGSDALEVLALLTRAEQDVIAVCTHGDVIWGVLDWLARGGVELGEKPDAQKASTWVLDWPDAPAEGVPIRASFLPPPVPPRASVA